MTKFTKNLSLALLLITIVFGGFRATVSLATFVPIVQTNAATGITASSVTLNAYIDAQGGNTIYWFEYGTNYSLGQIVGYQSLSFTSAQNVSFGLSGLSQNTTYYFRAVAQSQYGTTQGQILSFTATNNGNNQSAPIVQTNYSSNLTSNSATLNGSVNPNGGSVTYWFEFGQTPSFGQVTNSQSLGSYPGTINVTGFISNLIPNTNYSYRLVAQSQYGTTYGSVFNFITQQGINDGNCNNNNFGSGYNLPCVQTLQPANITANSVLLSGTVNARGSNATTWFEYGTNSGSLNLTTSPTYVSNNYNSNFTQSVNNLQPNTTYYARAAARNGSGVAYGQSFQFSTLGGSINVNQNSPIVTTKTANYVALRNTVLMNGMLNPQGNAGSAWFEYGTSYSLGTKTSSREFSSGSADISMIWSISGLAPGITYYYRAVAQTYAGLSYGSTLSFNFGTAVINNPNPVAPVPPAENIPPKTTVISSEEKVAPQSSKNIFPAAASLLSVFGSSALPWLLVILLLSFEVYRLFAGKESKKKTAKEKIQASISSEPAENEKRP